MWWLMQGQLLPLLVLLILSWTLLTMATAGFCFPLILPFWFTLRAGLGGQGTNLSFRQANVTVVRPRQARAVGIN